MHLLPIIFIIPNLLTFLDRTIPTIDTKVENTDTGHCQKIITIFKLILEEIQFNKKLSQIEWIVVADDDTLLRYNNPLIGFIQIKIILFLVFKIWLNF